MHCIKILVLALTWSWRCKQMQVHFLGQVDYEATWQRMKTWTEQRDNDDEDQLWVLEHPPVFTLGLNGKQEHLLFPGDIPIVQCDRGGQVTYHGPGQLVLYPLLNLENYGLGVRSLVTLIENSIVSTLERLDIAAYAKADAPGVYVDERKIASLGLRIYQQCSYHGLSINMNMDLEPFKRINPCGYQGLEMTQIVDYVPTIKDSWLQQTLVHEITQRLEQQRK